MSFRGRLNRTGTVNKPGTETSDGAGGFVRASVEVTVGWKFFLHPPNAFSRQQLLDQFSLNNDAEVMRGVGETLNDFDVGYTIVEDSASLAPNTVWRVLGTEKQYGRGGANVHHISFLVLKEI